MRFSFIHAADLHIDSPLQALGRKNVEAAARFAEAGRKALVALVDETLGSDAAFLLIAGDIFDGDWQDYATGLFFLREMARLERAGIPVFILRGNHDAASKMSRRLTWPANVREFSTRKAESFEISDLRVAVHGRSFADRAAPDDFVVSYPVRREGWLNIGVLHTSLNGKPGHDPYAPCTPDDLRRFGYEYWALGHIHKPEIVARDPWIVYSGNIQGRSVRETGPRGAFRVTVENGRIVDARHVALDAARWAHEFVDVSRCAAMDDVFALAREQMRAVYASGGERPHAIRLTLQGRTTLHLELAASADLLEAELQAVAAGIATDCWLERLRVETASPPRRTAAQLGDDALDVETLLQEAASDRAFGDSLAGLSAEIRARFPRELQDEFDAAVAADAAAIADEARSLLTGVLKYGGRE